MFISSIVPEAVEMRKSDYTIEKQQFSKGWMVELLLLGI